MTTSDRLAHRVEGEGEPLVLLNGGAMSFSAWEPIAVALRSSYKLIRCDFRGQLLSPGPAPASLDVHVSDVVRLLDHLGIAQAHILGASFGGEVAVLFAALAPDRASSLIAVTAVDFFGPEWKVGAYGLREACRDALLGGDRGRVYDIVVTGAFSPAYRAGHREELAARRAQVGALPDAWFSNLERLVASLEGLDLRPRLGAIRCPALVVLADKDDVMPRERSLALAAAIPGAQTVEIEGSGHALVAEKPAEFLRAVRDFLTRVSDAARASAP